MNELVTTDLILTTMETWVKNKEIIAPHVWLDASMKLNVLIGDEHDKLFDLQQRVAKMRVVYIQEGDTVAKAKSKVESEDVYRDMQKQKARIGQIEEFIRIAKIQARMKDAEWAHQ